MALYAAGCYDETNREILRDGISKLNEAAKQKYEVKAFFDRHNNHNAVGYQIEIFVGKQSNYLVRRIFSVHEAREVLHIQGMPAELARHSVYQLLPR